MESDRWEREIREALEPTPEEIAALRASALSASTRRRRVSRRWALAAGAAAALMAAWLAIPSAPRHVEPATDDVWTISNQGEVVRVRRGDQIWILGAASPPSRDAASRRLWVSVSAQ